MTDSDRAGNLEAVVRDLARRVSELEAHIASPTTSAVHHPDFEPSEHIAEDFGSRESVLGAFQPPHPRARGRETAAPSPETLDLERLIGRYGTLILATITILAAIGSFLAWSIANGFFGPWMRVVAGTVAAGALAFIGHRLRRKGERRFGNVVLSLALAALHVVAWALGPGLDLVPQVTALVVAAVASAALCAFAIRESDDDLLAVGFGGANLAPFVCGDRTHTPDVSLAAYGIVVFAAGVLATNGRVSRMTFRVIVGGLILFSITLLYAPDLNGSASLLSPLFALTASILVVVIGKRVAWRDFLRLTLAVAAFVSLTIAARFGDAAPFPTLPQLLAIVLLAFILWASAFALPSAAVEDHFRRSSAAALALFDYTLLPLLLLLAAVAALPAASRFQTAALCLLWAAVSGWLARRMRDSNAFDFLAAACCAEIASAPLALWSDRPAFCIPALALVAAMFGYSASRFRPKVPLPAALIVAALSFIWSLSWFAGLKPYTSFPFASVRSVAIGAAVVSGFFIVRLNRSGLPAIGIAAPWIAAFIWGDVELGRAFSRDASAFLLVAYFAACGVAILAFGTRRDSARMRQAGLALAVIAGLRALFETGATRSVPTRIGIYLVAGFYLMLVAYMYRKTSRVNAAPSTTL